MAQATAEGTEVPMLQSKAGAEPVHAPWVLVFTCALPNPNAAMGMG